MRVLYSFPHKFGAGRICYIAWQQVRGIAEQGARVVAFPGCVQKSVSHPNVTTRPTLALGPVRLPYRVPGVLRACMLHDWVVSRRLEALGGQIDVVHAWPLGALRTLQVAKRLGIPTVLERPNAHTRYAFGVVNRESRRLSVPLPPGSEHAYDASVLEREEEEYAAADYLLCPSEFVVRTFLDAGYAPEKLLRHQYGYDPKEFFAGTEARESGVEAFTALFVGYNAVRKGLHFALEAWLASPASQFGKFRIAGEFLPAYKERLRSMLAHPSVQVLGQRNDTAELMRGSDILLLPSIEEGFGLVCAEAMGSGCVPVVSDACTDLCQHMENALVHDAGNVPELTRQITMLFDDRELLRRLRMGCLAGAREATWDAAGRRLLEAYKKAAGFSATSTQLQYSAS
jgi:glycosyltransferase involved in cell wall biosynthesis